MHDCFTPYFDQLCKFALRDREFDHRRHTVFSDFIRTCYWRFMDVLFQSPVNGDVKFL